MTAGHCTDAAARVACNDLVPARIIRRRRLAVLNIPVLRWGKPYESLENDEVVHFITGEPIAKVSQANGGLLQRDMRQAGDARKLLREMPCDELIQRVKTGRRTVSERHACRWATARNRPTNSPAPNRPPPACPSTCAGRTCRRTSSCSRTWTRCSTR